MQIFIKTDEKKINGKSSNIWLFNENKTEPIPIDRMTLFDDFNKISKKI